MWNNITWNMIKDDNTIYHDSKIENVCYRYSTQIVDCPKVTK